MPRGAEYAAIAAEAGGGGAGEEEMTAAGAGKPFVCHICRERSTAICVHCTKDACDLHLCERCKRCTDCCVCFEQRQAGRGK